MYASKPSKTTYFDRINNFEETEFELDLPEVVEEQNLNVVCLKSFILSCRFE